MSNKQAQQETTRHLEAFDLYYSLGLKRTLRPVADKFDVTWQSVSNWHKWFNWDQRCTERDAVVSERFEEQSISIVLDQKQKMLAVVDALFDECMTVTPEGKVIPSFDILNMQDFERLAKLYLLLHGDPTSITEVKTNADDARRTLAERLDALSATDEAERIVTGVA